MLLFFAFEITGVENLEGHGNAITVYELKISRNDDQ